MLGCCLLSQKYWMLSTLSVIQCREEGMFASSWAFAVGTWWCSSWKAVLVSIRCWKWWGLWRDAQRCCVCSELDQGRASLHSFRYFPRIVMSHSLKPSMTFMIYGWNAGRIFHGLLRVPSLLLYQISYTIKKKKLHMLPKNSVSVQSCVFGTETRPGHCAIFLEGRNSII